MIAVERQRTADRINAVLNDPSVRPWVDNGTHFIDLTPRVADSNNILLMGEHGGCMFYPLMWGVYEVHTQVKREGRGPWTRQLAESCAHWMFTSTDCFEIMTRVPHGHIAAKAGALAIGMTHEFTRPLECRFREHLVDVHIYSYRIQDWVTRAPGLVEIGREFHDCLHDAAQFLGIADPPHGNDDNHNRYVGASIEMVKRGQLQKGVGFYNRWALASRHPLIRILRQDPPLVEIDHGLRVGWDGVQFRVTRG